MNTSIEDSITIYISYFTKQIQLVENHCPTSRDGDLHKRILYTAMLDAISRPIFIEQNNRERVVSLINKFCDWPEASRVSLSHLLQLVKEKTEPEFVSLRDFATQKISQWVRGDVILLNRDPSFSEVKQVWPHNNGNPMLIDGVKPNLLQHCHLFYSYRNGLVHEFKTLGRHAEIFDKDEPYYVQVTEYKDERSHESDRSWQLQYAAAFFKRLCLSAITNVEKYLIQSKIDPLETFAAGKYWIHELNK